MKPTTEEYISICNKIHNSIYDYKSTIYTSARCRIIIECQTHGEFSLRADTHKKGTGCPICSGRRVNTDRIVKDFIEVHGNLYNYSLVEYINMKSKVKIICKEHGIFEMAPHHHRNGIDCGKCKGQKLTIEDIKLKLKTINPDYNYNELNYTPGDKSVEIICPVHGKYKQLLNNIFSKNYKCPKCFKKVSLPEEEIVKYLKSIGVENIVRNSRSILGGKELDIYLPDYNLAIEYNGILWHSRGFNFPNNYEIFDTKALVNKTFECNEKDINLLHIFENEWIDLNKKEKWKSIIKNKLHKNEIKIGARKTSFQKITSKESITFCEENHLQGKGISSLNYGLFYNNELISVMAFSKARFVKDKNIKYEMIRFCNKKDYSIIGGASKLLKNFRELHKGGIVSYANRRWSNGHLYRTLQFTLKHISGINYFYFKPNENILWSRNKFQKHKLEKVLENFNKDDTEIFNVLSNGYRQIFDSGNYVFTLI